MTQPLGVDDFFTLEAGEYLDRLGSRAATPGLPNGDELVRFTRALRGSALMANQQAIARAASGLEHLVRSYRDGRRPWDADLAAVAREAVDVLRTLVERVRMWSAEDAARAERLALHLEKAAGGVPRPITTPTPSASETGVRAFLARESAALGSVLDQAARGLKSGSVSVDALQGVFRRMQPLRGLAALSDYPPLPDLLDGIERTVNAVAQLELPAQHGSERLDAAAAALSRAARDIADQGRPDIEGEEFRRFAGLLLEPEAEEPAILEIDALFFPGEDGVVQRGVVPKTPAAAALGAAPIVSRGEHLCQAADEILEATSTSQRDLRLHQLLRDLRTLGPGMPEGLDVAVEAFAVAARAAVSRGVAAEDPTRFAAVIREAGTRLRGYSEVTQPATLVHVFRQLVAEMEDLRPVPTRPTPAVMASPFQPTPASTRPVVAQAEPEIVPIEALELDEAPAEVVVPIEALAPSAPAEVVVPIEALAPSAPAELVTARATAPEWDLASSFSSYEALVRGSAKLAAAQAAASRAPVAAPPPVAAPIAPRAPLAPPPKVPALAPPTPPLAPRPPLAAPPPAMPYAAPAPVEAAAPAPIPPSPPPAAPAPAPEPVYMESTEQPVVDISELLYHGRSALLRADQIRLVLRAAVAGTDSVKAIRPLVDELLDLVELAIAD
jgi:chemotaxis protein histidine kinase CheA